MAQAYAILNHAALQLAIKALRPADPNFTDATNIVDDTARRQALVGVLAYKALVLTTCYTCDPAEAAVGDSIRRYKRQVAFTQAEIDGEAAAPAAPALTGIRPKLPTITKCNLAGSGVQLFLTSMTTHCTTLVFANDKQKCHFYVNNLTDSSKETLFAVHDPVAEDAWYTTANIVTYLEQFISKNKGKQALKTVRTVTMQGNKLFMYYTLMNKLFAECNTTPETTIPQTLQVRYFVDGLNPNSIPANLRLVLGTYLDDHPTSTVTELYSHAEHLMDTVLGPNHATSTNGNTGNAFVNPKRGRSGGQHQMQPQAKRPRPNASGNRNASGSGNGNPRHQSNGQSSSKGCGRCGHTSHQIGACIADFHRDTKYELTSPKPGALKGGTPPGFPGPPPLPARNPWTTVGKNGKNGNNGRGKAKASAKSVTLPAMKGTAMQTPRQQQQQQHQQQHQQQQKSTPRIRSIIIDPMSHDTDHVMSDLSSDSDKEEGELHGKDGVLSTPPHAYPKVSVNQSSYRSAVTVPRKRSGSQPRVVTFENDYSPVPETTAPSEATSETASGSPMATTNPSLNGEASAPRASLQKAMEKISLQSKKFFLTTVPNSVDRILERKVKR